MSEPVKISDLRGYEEIHCDIVVIGSGPAGVAAAVTAAHSGASVIVIEKYGFSGGQAVAGLSGTICGLYATSTDQSKSPEIIVGGFAQKFLTRLEDLAGVTGPIRYGNTYTRVHDPLIWRIAADQLLLEAKVKIRYHSTVIGVETNGPLITGVITSGVGGLTIIHADRFVDATGDASIVTLAGMPTQTVSVNERQNPTMMFRLQDVNVDRLYQELGQDSIMPIEISEKILEARQNGANLPRTKIFLFPTPRPGQLLVNATRIQGYNNEPLDVNSVDGLTTAEIQGRKQILSYFQFIRENIPGCESANLLDSGVQVGVRQSRQVTGIVTLTTQDVLDAKKWDTAITRSAWPIERHIGEKPELVWVQDDYYEVPLESLIPLEGEGLIVAGRCLSADSAAMASARVTAQCFNYGEAAGLTAAESISRNQDIRAVNRKQIADQVQRTWPQI
jgi:glycine/D-amino acid oxidase-like deaminating enzyme